MESIWIFAIIALIALVLFFKTTGVRFGKTWTIIIGFLILFFALSFSLILTKANSDLTSLDGFTGSIKTYFTWLGSFLDNISNIGGNVISTNWTENITR